MYLALFDSNWNALGGVTTHMCHSWSLTRRAYEMDSMTAVCEQIEHSADAVYCGLFENNGTLRWVGLAGMPKDEGGLTTVNAVDLRNVFRQEVLIDYDWHYGKGKTIRAVIEHLLDIPKDAVSQYRIPLGIDYTSDASELEQSGIVWSDSYLPAEPEVGNLWEVLQDLCMRLGFCIVAEASIGANGWTVEFVARPLEKTYGVKLSDFSKARVRNDSMGANMIQVVDMVAKQVIERYYVVRFIESGSESVMANGPTLRTLIISNKVTIRKPVISESLEFDYDADDTDDQTAKTESAKADAQAQLRKNLFKGSVQISLDGDLATDMREGTRLGRNVKGIQVYDQGQIYGYNSADDSTVRMLPVMWIREDQTGSKSVCFGRLDDYYYL